MKTKTELDGFYSSVVRKELEQLEKLRLDILDKHNYSLYKRTLMILLALTAFCFVLYLNDKENFKIEIGIGSAIITGLFLIIYPIVIIAKRTKSFIAVLGEHKINVIAKIVSFILPGAQYHPEEGISKDEVVHTGIFNRSDGYGSSNLISGKINGQYFKSATVYLYNTSKSKSHSGTSENSTVFDGLFVQQKLKFKVPQPIYIRTASKIERIVDNFTTGLLGNKLSSLLTGETHHTLFRTYDAEIDELFEIQCNDSDFAAGFIKSEVFKSLLAFKKERKNAVHFLIRNDEFYLAMDKLVRLKTNFRLSFLEQSSELVFMKFFNDAVGLAENVTVAKI